MGLAWMGVYQPWWPSTLVFLLNAFNIVDGGIDPRIYILVGNMLLPLLFITWFMGATEMLFRKKRWLIVGIYAAITILMDIIIIYFIIVDYTFLAEISVVNADYNLLMMIYLLFLAGSISGTGILMGRESLLGEDPKLKAKGRFLISASVFYVFLALLDLGLVDSIPAILFITRSIMMVSSILFYFGFFLPKPLEKAFIKQ
ncbi:MAG: conserved membrane protein of unknown function [Promethearchaeota archaeon]|nr:MAG: conserved membrane protein of unknown function [Candidatus Lokiarchaeota archaeon]